MSDKERREQTKVISVSLLLLTPFWFILTVEGFIHNIVKWYTVYVLALKMVIFRRVNVNVIPTLVFEK